MKCLYMKQCLLIVVSWGMIATSAANDTDGDKPRYRVSLNDDETVHVAWSRQNASYLFHVEVEVSETESQPDYMALGVSLTGGMKGADIWVTLFGEVNGSRLIDMHGVGNQAPRVDRQQNVHLISASRRAGRLQSVFVRHDSCDSHDLALDTRDRVYLIWAYGHLNRDGSAPNYHGINRGSKRVSLLQPAVEKFANNSTNQFIDFKKYSVTLAPLTTYYLCNIVKLPHFEQKVHFVGFQPLIQENNELNVHHIVLYQCSVPDDRLAVFQQYADTKLQHQCLHPSTPLDWHRCRTIVLAWGIGGTGEIAPDNVGVPIGAQFGSSDFFMLEVHYDNPEKRSNIVDSSGLRLFYTDRLRPLEAGMLTVGHKVRPFQMIPAGVPSYVTTGLCSSHCTDQLPADGIAIYSLFLHTHLAGRQVRLLHLPADRNRSASVVADNPDYDSNYQQIWTLATPVRVLPGDQLLLECTYNTSDRQHTTFGGLSTHNEMCLAFVSYYPRLDLSYCTSETDVGELLHELGVSELLSGSSALAVTGDQAVGDLIHTDRNSLLEPDGGGELLKELATFPFEERNAYLTMSPFRVVKNGSTHSLFDFLKNARWSDTVTHNYFRPGCETSNDHRKNFGTTFIATERFKREQQSCSV